MSRSDISPRRSIRRVKKGASTGPRHPRAPVTARISEVSDMDLAGALSYFGVTKLAADCEKDVFVAGKQPFITLAEEINQLARAENPQKVRHGEDTAKTKQKTL